MAELRELVKAGYRAGIEVILDLVFNHSAKGYERSPTINLHGFDNAIFYLLDGTGAANATTLAPATPSMPIIQ
jgi:pullulanase/glycogen debranching enzyme